MKIEIIKHIDIGEYRFIGMSKRGDLYAGFYSYRSDAEPTWRLLRKVLVSPRISRTVKARLRIEAAVIGCSLYAQSGFGHDLL